MIKTETANETKGTTMNDKDTIKARMQHYLMLIAMYRSEGDDANAEFYEGMYDSEQQDLIRA